MNKIYPIVIVIIVVMVLIFTVAYEPDIHTATQEQLTEITGIGDIKANLILSYLESNKEAEISDLEDIKGIGETLVERLEKEFR